EAEPPGKGRSDLLGIQDLPLDGARGHCLLGQGRQRRLVPERKAECLHTADESSLAVAHRGERSGQIIRLPAESRPVGKSVDVHRHTVRHALILPAWKTQGKSFTAYPAVF